MKEITRVPRPFERTFLGVRVLARSMRSNNFGYEQPWDFLTVSIKTTANIPTSLPPPYHQQYSRHNWQGSERIILIETTAKMSTCSAATGTAMPASSEDEESGEETDMAESQGKKQRISARKKCLYGRAFDSATPVDGVLAMKGSDKVEGGIEQRTRLISIKGIDIKKIHLNTLRDNVKARFGLTVSVRRKTKQNRDL